MDDAPVRGVLVRRGDQPPLPAPVRAGRGPGLWSPSTPARSSLDSTTRWPAAKSGASRGHRLAGRHGGPVRGGPLANISTSMTIDAGILYELVGERAAADGLSGRRSRQPRSTSPAGNLPPPVNALTVELRYCTERLPRWNTIWSLQLPHPRGQVRSTAAQELAFTLANGIAFTCRRRPTRGSSGSRAGSPFYSTPTTTSSRRWPSSGLPAASGREMHADFGARDDRLGDASLPRPDRRLDAEPAGRGRHRPGRRAGVLGISGGASLHTNALGTRRWRLPTERSATIGLRTQQVARAAARADPLAGSYYEKSRTDALIEQHRSPRWTGRAAPSAAVDPGWVRIR